MSFTKCFVCESRVPDCVPETSVLLTPGLKNYQNPWEFLWAHELIDSSDEEAVVPEGFDLCPTCFSVVLTCDNLLTLFNNKAAYFQSFRGAKKQEAILPTAEEFCEIQDNSTYDEEESGVEASLDRQNVGEFNYEHESLRKKDNRGKKRKLVKSNWTKNEDLSEHSEGLSYEEVPFGHGTHYVLSDGHTFMRRTKESKSYMVCRNFRRRAVICKCKGYLKNGKFFYDKKNPLHNHPPRQDEEAAERPPEPPGELGLPYEEVPFNNGILYLVDGYFYAKSRPNKVIAKLGEIFVRCRNYKRREVPCKAQGYLSKGKFYFVETEEHNHPRARGVEEEERLEGSYEEIWTNSGTKSLLVDGHPFIQDKRQPGEVFMCRDYKSGPEPCKVTGYLEKGKFYYLENFAEHSHVVEVFQAESYEDADVKFLEGKRKADQSSEIPGDYSTHEEEEFQDDVDVFADEKSEDGENDSDPDYEEESRRECASPAKKRRLTETTPNIVKHPSEGLSYEEVPFNNGILYEVSDGYTFLRRNVDSKTYMLCRNFRRSNPTCHCKGDLRDGKFFYREGSGHNHPPKQVEAPVEPPEELGFPYEEINFNNGVVVRADGYLFTKGKQKATAKLGELFLRCRDCRRTDLPACRAKGFLYKGKFYYSDANKHNHPRVRGGEEEQRLEGSYEEILTNHGTTYLVDGFPFIQEKSKLAGLFVCRNHKSSPDPCGVSGYLENGKFYYTKNFAEHSHAVTPANKLLPNRMTQPGSYPDIQFLEKKKETHTGYVVGAPFKADVSQDATRWSKGMYSKCVYCCVECDRYTIKPAGLYKHYRKEHFLVGGFHCKDCGRSFAGLDDYSRHEKEHAELFKNMVTCIQCGKVLESSKWDAHVSRTHKGFGGWRSFSSIVSGEKDVPGMKTCQLCPFRGEAEWRLDLHLLSTHQEEILSKKAYSCETCGEEFGSSASKDGHVNEVHLNVAKYKCKMCPEAFFYSTKWKSHMNLHRYGPQYGRVLCSHCGEEVSKRSLPDHVFKVHNIGEKEQKTCKVCKAKLESWNALVNHMAEAHNIIVPRTKRSQGTLFVCEDCGKSLSTSQLAYHRYKEHGIHPGHRESHRCHFCGADFLFVEELKYHRNHDHGIFRESLLKTGLICSLCRFAVPERGMLLDHLQVYHSMSVNVSDFKKYVLLTP